MQIYQKFTKVNHQTTKLIYIELEELEERYPDKSFIYVFQTVKTGAFRGDNAFQHHVDVVVEVPQKGKAVQYGRFNQGGELNIFENKMAA